MSLSDWSSLSGHWNSEVSPSSDTDRVIAEASWGERQKLLLLLSLRRQELMSIPDKKLQTVMDEIGRAAEARGLTPDVLKKLLQDE